MIQRIGFTSTTNQQPNSVRTKEKRPQNKETLMGKLHYLRTHQDNIPESYTKALSAIGGVVGTAIPLLMIAKKQKVKPFDVEYGLGEMCALAIGGITGAVTGGAIGADKQERKRKVNEGVFQFLNVAVPAGFVAGVTKLTKSVPALNNTPTKIVGVVVGLATGIMSAVKLSNFIVDPKDKEPDRKLTVKDAIANLDDAAGVLVLADVKCAKKMKIERVIPFISAYCGYRAGNCN